MVTRIALDAMGGDFGSQVLIEGAVKAIGQLPELEIILVGEGTELNSFLESKGISDGSRLSVVSSRQYVGMDEGVKESLRKQESSIAVAARLVAEGKAQGLVSAGNTASSIAHTVTLWGNIPGIRRPAIASLLPTLEEPVVLIDVGANLEPKPENILEFALMGSVYARYRLGRKSPRIGLLNIGEEISKGTKGTQKAYEMLAKSSLNFRGNAEGRDLLSGKFDVVVCDGFIGNILLKFGEAVAELLLNLFKQYMPMEKHPWQAIIERFRKKVDYAEFGGAPLLGVNGVCVICHGMSVPRAIMNAIMIAAEFVENNINQHITEELKKVSLETIKTNI